jgi:hypothetical protein
MQTLPASVFILCLVTSAACAWLLFRQYRKTPSGLLFWSALCFLALTANNFLVVVDLVVFPESVSLLPFRHAASLAAIGVLLYGFIREST